MDGDERGMLTLLLGNKKKQMAVQSHAINVQRFNTFKEYSYSIVNQYREVVVSFRQVCLSNTL